MNKMKCQKSKELCANLLTFEMQFKDPLTKNKLKSKVIESCSCIHLIYHQINDRRRFPTNGDSAQPYRCGQCSIVRTGFVSVTVKKFSIRDILIWEVWETSNNCFQNFRVLYHPKVNVIINIKKIANK